MGKRRYNFLIFMFILKYSKYSCFRFDSFFVLSGCAALYFVEKSCRCTVFSDQYLFVIPVLLIFLCCSLTILYFSFLYFPLLVSIFSNFYVITIHMYIISVIFTLHYFLFVSFSVPNDYVHSTQEEADVIEVLCMKEGVPQITLSDSDSDVVRPLPPPKERLTLRSRLKLSKSSGELTFYVVDEVN